MPIWTHTIQQLAAARAGARPAYVAAALAGLAAMAFAGWPVWLWALSALPGAALAGLSLAALLLLPGLALLRLLWVGPLATDEGLALALSLGCTVPPLALLASGPVGLAWGGPLAWAALALCALVALWPRGRPAPAAPAPPLALPALLLITAASLAARLYATRELAIGEFGDSVHHTIIAQLLVDNGGLFRSWRPYAELTTLTYHYGFHSLAAGLHWLSGLPVRLALLSVGQTQSALAAPLIYLLTLRLGGGRPAALWAALIAGLLSAMPAYYASWGRYTQLGGQTALIGVCVAWMALLDTAGGPAPRPADLARQIALAGIGTAGLALIHYRVAIFAACFVLAYAAYLLAARLRAWRPLARVAGAGLAGGGLALLLIAPWLLRLREGRLLMIGGNLTGQNIGTEGVNGIPTSILGLLAPWPLVALSAIALGLILWRRRWLSLVLPLWAALTWVAANPYLIGLTGAGIISNFAVLIASYLLLAPLAGIALAWLGDLAARWPPGRHLAPAAGLALAAWGLTWQPLCIDRANELLRPADLAAMAWIARATPPEARFFVNSFPAYGDTLYAGSDGGWLLTLFAGRASNLPPITYGSEAGPGPDYRVQVNGQNAAIMAHPVASAAAAAALRAAGYTYLYDGPAASPPGEYIDPAALAQSPLYERVYAADGVTIWRLP